MENKINIAEILRDMPKGTKLYSPLFGECNLDEVCTSDRKTYPIILLTSADTLVGFTKNGHYVDGFEDAECLLFPSAKMRDWSKFFKRGDVVFNKPSGLVAIFDGWVGDDYTEFNTTINRIKNDDFGDEEEDYITELFSKVTDEERAEFIAAAEKHYGGKYNPETLQVEPVKVSIPKCLLKPFDKVLVRDSDAGIWKAAHFSHYIGEYEYPYFTTASAYKQCVPYDCNEYLLGTNKSPE